jgi:hypothetical protein
VSAGPRLVQASDSLRRLDELLDRQLAWIHPWPRSKTL